MQLQALVASLALLGTAHASGIYSKNSPVLQVNAKNYDKLIAKSNYTSIVEFYAPWCGHCKNLKPAYEKAATNLAGLAHVAAIDCDTDANKPFCSSMDVRGFPTLKIVRPAKRAGGAPIVDDYNGPRTATGIVEAVVDKINNHVRRVTDADVAEFLGERAEGPKALLFTEKGTTSPLLKSIAIDFLDVIAVGQIRSKEAETVARFGVTSFPTLVLLPGGDKEPIVYEGEMKKASIVKFLSQAGDPNPDPAPSKSDKNKAKKAKEAAEEPAAEEPIVVEPVEEPEVNEAPPQEQQPAPITTLMTTDEITTACLHPKAGTCVFALVPEEKHEAADALLEALAELVHKNEKAGRALLFPLYAVPAVNPSHAALAAGLGMSGEVEVVAVNAKRGWWKHYQGDLSPGSVTEWVDDIRMGEGAKSRLPEGIVVDPATGSEAEAETQAETQAETVESEEAAADTRDEL